jgi:hypothetical protein
MLQASRRPRLGEEAGARILAGAPEEELRRERTEEVAIEPLDHAASPAAPQLGARHEPPADRADAVRARVAWSRGRT